MEQVEQLRAVLEKYWGYREFRPLQREAMESVLADKDSVIVLPTGGGKSLCFQAPAMVKPGLAVVVSPLIALMQDQVDGLKDCGIEAASLNSGSAGRERVEIAEAARSGRLKLLYLSPERLMTERMLEFLHELPLSFFAIDEAHCISDWGHDFRPEYRMLNQLKEMFPDIAIHAYTATATEQVRGDIVRELGLVDPCVLVGSFDRPNLIYRVQRRADRLKQIQQVLDKHPDESGVIYCIRRADVEEVCASLQAAGYKAVAYHAGMSDADRSRNQEDFQNDRAQIIVATVAFGMGIDKSDVRFVIHAGTPKSIEAYQQESGRAGRDGLDAECWLFYSPADFITWRKFQEAMSPEAARIAAKLLDGMDTFCSSPTCRHRTLVNYFGQEFPDEPCGACDVCLEEIEWIDDALVASQKILSCVIRLGQRFGGDYVAQVLIGSKEKRILERGDDRLSTYGILQEFDRQTVRDWIEQLVVQGYLERVGEYGVLQVAAAGRPVLKGEVTPKLQKRLLKPKKESKAVSVSWEGVDRDLFDALRALRRSVSEEKSMPPFMIFSDATIRAMAARRPSDPASMLRVSGVGEKKYEQYGERFLELINEQCQGRGLSQDVETAPAAKSAPLSDATAERPRGNAKTAAFEMFAQGHSVEVVSAKLGRAMSTTSGYLLDFIVREGIVDPSPWVKPEVSDAIVRKQQELQTDRLAPIFEAFGGEMTYDQIRIVMTCQKVAGAISAPDTEAAATES